MKKVYFADGPLAGQSRTDSDSTKKFLRVMTEQGETLYERMKVSVMVTVDCFVSEQMSNPAVALKAALESADITPRFNVENKLELP